MIFSYLTVKEETEKECLSDTEAMERTECTIQSFPEDSSGKRFEENKSSKP